MPNPLSPASNQSSPPIHLPADSRPLDATLPQQAQTPQRHLQGDQGEKLQLSGASVSSSTSIHNNDLARGIAQAAIASLGRAEHALTQIHSLSQGGQLDAEVIHPHAMQILEATAIQHRGVSPLERNGVAVQAGQVAVPSYILAGEETDALVEISSLVPATTSGEKLQVSLDNVRWAREQYQSALEALDLQHAQQTLPAGAPESRPQLPGNLSAGLHQGLQPGRIVGLLSG